MAASLRSTCFTSVSSFMIDKGLTVHCCNTALCADSLVSQNKNKNKNKNKIKIKKGHLHRKGNLRGTNPLPLSTSKKRQQPSRPGL
ncbi:hypothetical protein I7I50_03840 [Histoplasma capsulatum G186AR]|uniref:Uncharacterized protein n=1 Tax=Ajellomyces capsulatus TaxID=5037 RepID=A0A8H7YJC7_AJECA|nr:hypothetical protein I7I52_04748 [Histoplasma capsulatum]QSS74890.1 hypothetical protein I7I50_03840 [Histoplasma capsulatum G186AR]